jgi:hypothetical protein
MILIILLLNYIIILLLNYIIILLLNHIIMLLLNYIIILFQKTSLSPFRCVPVSVYVSFGLFQRGVC